MLVQLVRESVFTLNFLVIPWPGLASIDVTSTQQVIIPRCSYIDINYRVEPPFIHGDWVRPSGALEEEGLASHLVSINYIIPWVR